MLLLTLCLAAPATASADTNTRAGLFHRLVFEQNRLPIMKDLLFEPEDNQREVICLALNIYHEARGTPKRAQYAVGFATKNRVSNSEGTKTICEVVWKSSVVRGRRIGQFSWTTHSVEWQTPRESAAWLQAQQEAYEIFWGQNVSDFTHGATYFYSSRLRRPPKWAYRGLGVQRIGGQVFLHLA